MARYLVGIDLGTTHTVVALRPIDGPGPAVPALFEIEQLVAPGEVGRRPLLPSLRYHPGAEEVAPDDVALPWPNPDLALQLPVGVIGELAREFGSRVPGRLVSSAKSWLSHRSVDRTEPILPVGCAGRCRQDLAAARERKLSCARARRMEPPVSRPTRCRTRKSS